jgi:DNA-binding NarL/FixJ family response regulator
MLTSWWSPKSHTIAVMTDAELELRSTETELEVAPEPEDAPEPEPKAPPPLQVLLYASDRTVREHVRLSLGRKVAMDLPEVRVLEVATQPAVITAMDRGGIALAILDGEAVPGGMGLCRQLKDEVPNCPPVLVLTGRRDDAWLATWSRAEGVLPHPVDPFRLPEAVARLLRQRLRLTAS